MHNIYETWPHLAIGETLVIMSLSADSKHVLFLYLQTLFAINYEHDDYYYFVSVGRGQPTSKLVFI